MINSADTSFHFTTEWQDRGRKGGIERERKGHVVKKERHQCEGNTRGQQGGMEEDRMTCGWRHYDAMDSVTQKKIVSSFPSSSKDMQTRLTNDFKFNCVLDTVIKVQNTE